ncbi:hypothetical protein C5Y84_22355 [Escherichia coli]|nr:hypothetical protein C5Y84_22355 [Escherichia coli]
MLFCQCYAAAPSTYVIPTCDCYSALHGAPFFLSSAGNDSNLLIVFYVQIMPDDFVMQLHRF